MHRSNRMAFTNVTQMLLDILCLVVSFVLTWSLLNWFYEMPDIADYFWMLLLFGPLFFFSMNMLDMYNRSHFTYHDRIIRNIFLSCLTATLVCVAILPSMNTIPYLKRFLGVYIIAATLLLTSEWIATTTFVISKMRKQMPKSLLVGDHANIEKYMYYMKKTTFNASPIGYIASACATEGGKIPCLGTLDELETILGNNIVDEVIFAMPHTYVGQVEKYMDICEQRGLTVKVALDFNNMSHSKSCITSVGPIPVITYHTVSLNEIQLFIKRVMDIGGALIGLLLTAVASVFIIPAILMDSPGPVIFRQMRMGKNGRTFMLYKFRSMCNDAEHLKKQLENKNEMSDGMMFKIKDDPRITKVGAFLRKTSLDELPQFINILKGDMSLVGTRPPTMDEVTKYASAHHRRISIKPGLTGMWQVSGRSNIQDFDEVVRLDVQYIDTWTIWKDISILFHTIWVIIDRRQGAY